MDWLKPRLFTPLGIRNPQWLESVKGYTLGCGGLHLSTEELSRFGQLCLNKGQWEGKRLISASWIEEATSCQISNKIEGKTSTQMNVRDMDIFSGDALGIMHIAEKAMLDKEFLFYQNRMRVSQLQPMNLILDRFQTAYGLT